MIEPKDEPYDVDEDGYRDPWCRDFDGHKALHDFCIDHQMFWCRGCDRVCPSCMHDPRCPECGCSLFTDYHEWDCGYADKDDE